MNLGTSGIIFQTGNFASGPPFVPTSANNGLSVDTITGKIVLGNDAAGSSAILLSNREIPNGGFSLAVKDVTSTFGMGFFSSNFVNGVPIVANGYNKDSDTNAIFLQNTSGGTHAASLIGVYNNLSTNFRVGVTGSGFNSPFTLLQFPPDVCFFQTQSNGNNAQLYMTAQNGIFFQSDLVANPVTPSMKLQNGDLTMITGDILVKTSRINDNATRMRISPVAGALQIFTPGSGANVSIFNTGGTNGITFDAATRIIDCADTTTDMRIQSGTGRLGIGVAPTEKLQVNGNIRLSGIMNVAGTPGFTGTVTPVNSITVVGGIVTAVS